MNIEVFALCDAATDSQGKLNMLGAFDTIFAAGLPTVHPQFAVVLRLRLKRIEKGRHKLALHIVDDDGKHVVQPIEGGFEVNFASGDTATGAINAVFNIHNVKLEKYGEYAVNLAIDGRQEASLPLYVKQA